MKKKIMLIVPMLHQGGFERVCVLTARLLEPFFEVFIVIFDSADIAFDIKGLNIIDLHMGVKKDLISKCLNVVKRSLAVRSIKKKLKIDIAYSFGPTANMVNVFSKSKGKVWVGIRSYMDMSSEWKLRLFCKKADKILCCSETIEQEFITQYNCSKTMTLYNPVDIQDLQNRAQDEEPRLPWENTEHIIASMGREDDIKGFWHLIKSFALVRSEFPDVKLMIIGDGEYEDYRNLAKQLGLGEYVFFTGMKKNPFPYLKAAEFYVLSSYYEGFPNALLEAMALGLPVIATDCMTGPREIVLKCYNAEENIFLENEKKVIDGEYGVLIPDMGKDKNFDPDLITQEEIILAEEIKRMLSDKVHYEKYQKASLIRVIDYSYQAYVDILKKQIEMEEV